MPRAKAIVSNFERIAITIPVWGVGLACMAAVRLRSQHLWVGEDAVLDAIQGKLPEAVSSMGVDSYALIEAGYDVNYADKEGITLLMAATEKNDQACAKSFGVRSVSDGER